MLNPRGFEHSSIKLFLCVKVKREVIERLKQGGVMLCNCVTFVSALLWFDCSVTAP